MRIKEEIKTELQTEPGKKGVSAEKVKSSNIRNPDLGSLSHTVPALGQGGASSVLPGCAAVFPECGSEPLHHGVHS